MCFSYESVVQVRHVGIVCFLRIFSSWRTKIGHLGIKVFLYLGSESQFKVSINNVNINQITLYLNISSLEAFSLKVLYIPQQQILSYGMDQQSQVRATFLSY